MQSPIPRHWRYGVLILLITLASTAVLLPTMYLASISSSAAGSARQRAQEFEALRRGRTVQIGGRGAIQPLRQQKRSMTGLARRIRLAPFGQGTLPELTNAQKRLIKRRATLKLNVRNDTIIAE